MAREYRLGIFGKVGGGVRVNYMQSRLIFTELATATLMTMVRAFLATASIRGFASASPIITTTQDTQMVSIDPLMTQLKLIQLISHQTYPIYGGSSSKLAQRRKRAPTQEMLYACTIVS